VAPKPLTVEVNAGEKFFIAGQTRSGKSVLATHLASRFDRVVVFDPKWGDPAATLPNATVVHSAREAVKRIPGRVIYQPDAADGARIQAAWDEICARVWFGASGGICVVVHELPFLATPWSIGPHFAQLITAGGLFGITVILVSQRPSGIPVMARSESVHWACFTLLTPDDRNTMADVMGEPVRGRPLPMDHSFWYRSPNGRLRLCEPIHAPTQGRPDAPPAP
jgi:hypothetical protein